MIIDPENSSFQDNHKIMIGSILPRPIAFVSTQSKEGNYNLAPFSYFNGICSNPPSIMFAPLFAFPKSLVDYPSINFIDFLMTYQHVLSQIMTYFDIL